jgi:hypothetical protein
MDLVKLFPELGRTLWSVTSPRSRLYNCVAWAAEDDTRWWWPGPTHDSYWPVGAPREATVEAFIAAFALLGYDVCERADRGLDPGYEKVAIYAKADEPTHVARQLSTGEWTSKCGGLEDITHTLEALAGDRYGAPVVVMRRPREGRPG